MKNIFLLLLFLPFISISQPLMVEGTAPNHYLLHKIGPKENFYSIGRIYNISPRVMAPFNDLQLENGLSIGKNLKIPLTEQNFNQDGVITEDEVLVPLYHKVKAKETLITLSNAYNKVSVPVLKKWNHLSAESILPDTRIIIGYLKVKKDLSSLAGKAVNVEKSKMQNQPAADVSVAAKTEVPSAAPKDVKTEPVKKEVEKPVETPKNPAVVTPDNKPETAFNGGAFKAVYQTQIKGKTIEQSGKAGVFKSTSGWEDGKYYCLHNSAAAGTIIKVTNPQNNRSIYAKVLDVIPDLKQNEGMIIRISNAAASELGISEVTFDCSLNFY